MKVFAREYWNDTAINIKAGERLHFNATGQWKDFIILTDANGFSKWHLKPFEKLRRKPDSPWFSLIGAIDHKHLFHIDLENTIKMPASGRLYLFANDVKYFYWNNNGCVFVEIYRPNSN